MSSFTDVLKKIAEGIEDISSLEVTTFKGKIDIASQGMPADFDAILANAQATAGFQIAASTKCALDGDIRVFYDAGLEREDMDDHRALVETAEQNRQAVINLFHDAIRSALGK